MTEKQHAELLAALQQNTQASNRTTHAVRAIVLFFFIQLGFVIAAVFVSFLGTAALANGDGNGYFGSLIFASLLAVTGFITSVVVGMKEIGASRISTSSSDQTIENQNRAANANDLSAKLVKAVGPLSDDDFNKVVTMLEREKAMWEKAGKPSLASWSPLLESFETWFKKQDQTNN